MVAISDNTSKKIELKQTLKRQKRPRDTLKKLLTGGKCWLGPSMYIP